MPTRRDFLDTSLDFSAGGQPTSGGLSNPFAGLFGGGGGTNPVAAAVSTSAPSPMAPAPSPTYNAFFDPSAGGARGLLGSLMGNPTRQEYAAQKVGSARAAGFRKLSDAIEAGVPPQKAILQFVETPEGQNFFATSTDPAGELAQYMNQAVGKPKEDYTLNGQRFSGQTNEVIATGAEQDTEAVRTFRGMSQIAGLSPEEQATLARGKLAAGEGDPTQSEAAMEQLVKAGKIDPLTAQKWLAGVISIVPVKDAAGNVTGQQVFDASTNQVINLGGPNIPAASTIDEPTIDPKTTAPGEPLRRLSELGLNPADVVDGAGPVGTFGEKIGGLLGNLPGFGDLSGGQSAIKRQGLNQIAADAGTLLDVYSKNNRASKQDSDNIKTIIGGISGLTTNPTQAAEKLIMFNDYLDTRDKIATEDAGNSALTQQQRGDALAEQSAIRRARANLPDREALKAKLAALKTSPSPVEQAVPDVKAGLGAAEEDAKKAVGEVAKKPDGSEYKFDNIEGLRKAVQAGTVKAGDTVIINGKKEVIQSRKKAK